MQKEVSDYDIRNKPIKRLVNLPLIIDNFINDENLKEDKVLNC